MKDTILLLLAHSGGLDHADRDWYVQCRGGVLRRREGSVRGRRYCDLASRLTGRCSNLRVSTDSSAARGVRLASFSANP